MEGELLRIGSITLYWFGTALAVAFLVGTALAAREAERRNLDPLVVVELAGHLMIVGSVAGRVGYVFPDLPFYVTHPLEFFRVSPGGLSYVPAFVAGLVYIHYFARDRHLRFWEILDVLTPGLVAGLIIGSLGAVEVQPKAGAVYVGSFFWSPPTLAFFTIEYVGCRYIAASSRRMVEGRRFLQVVMVDALARTVSSLWAWILYKTALPHAFSVLAGLALLVWAVSQSQRLASAAALGEVAVTSESEVRLSPRRRRLPTRQRALRAAVWFGIYVLLVVLLGRTQM